MLIPRVVIWIAQEFCTISVVELDDLSSSANPIHTDMFTRLEQGGG